MSLDALDTSLDDTPNDGPELKKKPARKSFLLTSPRGFQAVELHAESSNSSDSSTPRDDYVAMQDVPSPTLETSPRGAAVPTMERAASRDGITKTSSGRILERVASGKVLPALDVVPLSLASSTASTNFEIDSRLRSISAPVEEDHFARLTQAMRAKPREESPPEPRHYRSLSTPRVGFATATKSRDSEMELVPITVPTNASEFRVTLRQLRSLKQLDNKRVMSYALVNFVQSEESIRGNSIAIWAARMLAVLLMAVAVILIMLLPKYNDPAKGAYENLTFALFVCPYVTFFACISLTSHILTVLKLDTPIWKCAICALCSAFTIGASAMILAQFDIFPVPYWPVTAGCVAVAVCLIVAIAFQPKGTLTDPVMRKKLRWALVVIMFNAGGSFLYAFYVALFSFAQGNWQTVVAPLLAVMKVGVKHSNAAISRRLENPDFKHGTALFPDICGTCVSAIIFVNVNSLQTFLLLLTIDTAINLKHCLGILAEITQSQKLKHQRIVRGLCVSRRDAQACSSAIKELQSVTLTPELVELCGDLFFGEITESLVPVIMGMSAWIAYYLPNCNRQWITFMWQNTETDFVNGMSYVALDCSIQLALFFFLTRYMRFKTGVDINHVGLAIMSRHKLLFTLMTFGITSFFFLLFVDHAGVDTSLRFKWLREGYNASAIVRLTRPCD